MTGASLSMALRKSSICCARPSGSHRWAMITRSRRLGNLDLSGVQPPFGYLTLLAEAERIRKRG